MRHTKRANHSCKSLSVFRLEDRLTPTGPVPVGPEFQVNTYTTDTQSISATAMDINGDFVVAWMSNNQDGDDFGIFAQRFNATGVPQGPEIQVNTFTSGKQSRPAVAMDDAGDFVVAWNSYGQLAGQGGSDDIFARRYSSAGIPVTGEIQVNTYTSDSQHRPAVAMDAVGDFVVCWMSQYQDGNSYGIYAQRFSSEGLAQGAEFLVNSYTGAGSPYDSPQQYPAIAMNSSGNFVIAWISRNQAPDDDQAIYARRFAANGAPIGSEFHVNAVMPISTIRNDPSVAISANGAFVISWTYNSFNSPEQDEINLKRFTDLGIPSGSEIHVNTYTSGYQSRSKVAIDSDGNFVVVWESGTYTGTGTGPDGSFLGVYAQEYDHDGIPQGSEFLVNTFTQDRQYYGSIAMNGNGEFVVDWSSIGQDGSGHGIFAQRFSPTTSSVQSMQIENGATQRSRVTQLAIDFDSIVALAASPADAFQLRRQSDNALVALTASVINNSATHVLLTFNGVLSEYGSLADGRYTLTALASQINGGNFDGDGNGISGDDYTYNFHRLFGDADGNGIVSAIDFNAFRLDYGTGLSIFDFNNDGQTNAADFAAFGDRYGMTLVP